MLLRNAAMASMIDPKIERRQIRALLVVACVLHYAGFCHVYMFSLEDSVGRHNHGSRYAHTSKTQYFSFVLDSSMLQFPHFLLKNHQFF